MFSIKCAGYDSRQSPAKHCDWEEIGEASRIAGAAGFRKSVLFIPSLADPL